MLMVADQLVDQSSDDVVIQLSAGAASLLEYARSAHGCQSPFNDGPGLSRVVMSRSESTSNALWIIKWSQ
jgi:hypothetical protein